MRNVVFAAPFPLDATMRFARALARIRDVRLFGVMQEAPGGEDRAAFADVVRVTDGLAAADLIDACELLRRRHGALSRILGILDRKSVV